MIEQVSLWNDLDIADPDFGPVLDKTKFSARDVFLSGESVTAANEAWSTLLSQKSHTWNEAQNKMWAKKVERHWTNWRQGSLQSPLSLTLEYVFE